MIKALLLPSVALVLLVIVSFIFSARRPGHELTPRGAVLQTRLRWLGLLLLAGGLCWSVLIYRRANPAEPGDTDIIGYDVTPTGSFGVTPDQSKRYNAAMERIGGKANVAVMNFEDWLATQRHGRNLATNLAILSCGACLTCFLIGRLVP